MRQSPVLFIMMDDLTPLPSQIQERWVTLQVSFFLSLLTIFFSFSKGFFTALPPWKEETAAPQISAVDVFKGFGVFMVAQIFVAPLLFFGVSFFYQWISSASFLSPLDPSVFSWGSADFSSFARWLPSALLFITFFCLFGVYRSLSLSQKEAIWHRGSASAPTHFFVGVLSCLICYPLVLFLNQVIALSLWYFASQPFVEQTVVKQVRLLIDDPWLFLATAFSIVALVPWSEEFLFRALLQSWLKSLFRHSWAAIALSSLIFSLFHFSFAQGLNNIDLLFSLFFLSCMLGYLFERQGSLWAPIGLHSFFNGVNLLMLYLRG